jgi:hypothetical protein
MVGGIQGLPRKSSHLHAIKIDCWRLPQTYKLIELLSLPFIDCYTTRVMFVCQKLRRVMYTYMKAFLWCLSKATSDDPNFFSAGVMASTISDSCTFFGPA